jgi:hypothetical protein
VEKIKKKADTVAYVSIVKLLSLAHHNINDKEDVHTNYHNSDHPHYDAPDTNIHQLTPTVTVILYYVATCRQLTWNF